MTPSTSVAREWAPVTIASIAFSGSCDPFATNVIVQNNGVGICDAPMDGTSWSFSVPQDALQGSSFSFASNGRMHIAPPSPPVVTSVTLAGTCPKGAVVEVYNGAALLGNATVDGERWTYTSAGGTVNQPCSLAAVNACVVIFDLVQGASSAHSARTFAADRDYTIFVRVHSTATTLNTGGTGWGEWHNAQSLGKKDKVVVVGSHDEAILGASGRRVSRFEVGGPPKGINNAASSLNWFACGLHGPYFAVRLGHTCLTRFHGSSFQGSDNQSAKARLFATGWGSYDNNTPNGGFSLSYLDADPHTWKTLPAGLLTSQGLA